MESPNRRLRRVKSWIKKIQSSKERARGNKEKSSEVEDKEDEFVQSQSPTTERKSSLWAAANTALLGVITIFMGLVYLEVRNYPKPYVPPSRASMTKAMRGMNSEEKRELFEKIPYVRIRDIDTRIDVTVENTVDVNVANTVEVSGKVDASIQNVLPIPVRAER